MLTLSNSKWITKGQGVSGACLAELVNFFSVVNLFSHFGIQQNII